MTDFWGLRKTSSKGMRFNERLIWHYFTYQQTWAMGQGFFTICRATFPDGIHTLEKRKDKPLGKECCAECHAEYNKKVKDKETSLLG